jgi:hypothetical protein
MSQTKVIVNGQALYEAVSGKLIKDGFAGKRDVEDYVNHHYLVLPVADYAGRPWMLDGQPVYCLRGTQYETLDGRRIHLARCPDCGGMGIRMEVSTVESDCIRCIACGHEFDARLEMMET